MALKQVISISIDLTNLKFIGKGTQGKVYKIDHDKCIKIFKSNKDCKDELKTLLMAQSDAHFPKLYGYGTNYIIREYIEGIELNEYLSIQKLISELSSKIIKLYGAMVNVGFLRCDAAIFHIFITPSNDLKLIDTSKAMRRKSMIPDLLISGLDKANCKDDFFIFLKNKRPDLYTQWINYTKKRYKKIY